MLSAMGALPAQTAAGPSPAQRRAAVLQSADQGPAALAALSAALQDENLVVRRTALRVLSGLGEPARPALARALGNSDALVRRAALLVVCDPLAPDSVAHLEKALADPDPLVRLAAVHLLVRIRPTTAAVQGLLDRARRDEAPAVREVAAKALWPFHKDTVSIRDRKDWDHDIQIAETIPLPAEGWRLRTDPKEEGHLEKWFAPEYDDSAWPPIEIGKAWEEQGQTYDGVAWYRGAFGLPAKPECLAVEMAFGGVDEIAWVWVNGEYVGQHDLGTAGWDKPFALDVTQALKWGEQNQVTVRVQDSAYAGGIWKPVVLQVLR
jgi:hypothetical protein